jgi:YesN/AraC family two-component response regulator
MAEIQVVLADDDELALTHLRRLLGSFARVRVLGVARDGREAVELVDRVRPDVVFVDVEMPGLSGFQVLKAIRHKPIAVVVTAHGRYGRMVLESDAIECLHKPVDLDQVQRAMDKIENLIKASGRLNGARGGE